MNFTVDSSAVPDEVGIPFKVDLAARARKLRENARKIMWNKIEKLLEESRDFRQIMSVISFVLTLAMSIVWLFKNHTREAWITLVGIFFVMWVITAIDEWRRM